MKSLLSKVTEKTSIHFSFKAFPKLLWLIAFVVQFVLISFEASSRELTFDQVDSYHKNIIDSTLKSYGLSDKMEVTYFIEMRDSFDLKKSVEPIEIPGLILDADSLLDQNRIPTILDIVRALPAYKRRFSIVLQEKVIPEEVENFRQSLQDRLAIQEDETVEVVDNSFQFRERLQQLPEDLLKSFFKNFVQNGQLFWAILFLLAIPFLLVGAWLVLRAVFTRVFSGLGEAIESGAEKVELSIPQQERELEKFDEEVADKATDSDQGSELSELDSLNLPAVLTKLGASFERFGSEMKGYLWSEFARPEKQIRFYEFVEKSDAPEEVKKQTLDLLESTFDFKGDLLDETDKQEVSTKELFSSFKRLNQKLTSLKFKQPDPVKSEAMDHVFPRFGLVLDSLIQSSLSEFGSLIYVLFPNQTVQVLKKSPALAAQNPNLLAQLASGKSEKVDKQSLDRFLEFLSTEEMNALIDKEKSAQNQDLRQVFDAMPESVLEGLGFFDQEEYKDYHEEGRFPRLSWISAEDRFAFKRFILGLQDVELIYLNESVENFDSMISSLDERTQVRCRESLRKQDSINSESLDWVSLRRKIKEHFSQKSEEKGLNEEAMGSRRMAG